MNRRNDRGKYGALSFGEILSRCLHSKCPVCGTGRLFAKLTRLGSLRDFFLPLEECEFCHFHFARQPGYYLGVVTPILPILALAVGAIFAVFAYLVFDLDLNTILSWGSVGLGIGFILLFRTAVAIYVSIDHAVDPPTKDADTEPSTSQPPDKD